MKKAIILKFLVFVPCLVFGMVLDASDLSLSAFTAASLPFLWSFFISAMFVETVQKSVIFVLPLSAWLFWLGGQNTGLAFLEFASGLSAAFAAKMAASFFGQLADYSRAGDTQPIRLPQKAHTSAQSAFPRMSPDWLAFSFLLVVSIARPLVGSLFILALSLFSACLFLVVLYRKPKHEAVG